MAAFLELKDAVAAAPYLAYYRKRYGAKTHKGESLWTDVGIGSPTDIENDPKAALAAYRASLATSKRRSLLAEAQGVGAEGDLTDTVVQDAAAMERRRRTVGRTGASTFLSSKQSLLAGAL